MKQIIVINRQFLALGLLIFSTLLCVAESKSRTTVASGVVQYPTSIAQEDVPNPVGALLVRV
jgi:hypothetical protein